MRFACSYTLQITTSATPDALCLRGLCRTCLRFNNWISAVSIVHILLILICFGPHHAVRGVCSHTLQITAFPDALRLRGLCLT
jgi:hypothetical protein